jgi:hypothetical protein
MQLLGAVMRLLGAVMRLLGAVMWLLGAAMWLLGAVMRLLGAVMQLSGCYAPTRLHLHAGLPGLLILFVRVFDVVRGCEDNKGY